jgi:hypothetical protein
VIDRVLDMLASLANYWNAAMAAIDGASMIVALVLTTAIFAAGGGLVSGKMRLYGAVVGGMLVNAVVKAMGGGFAAALAAMLVTTAVGYVLGCTPLLLRLLTLQKRRN